MRMRDLVYGALLAGTLILPGLGQSRTLHAPSKRTPQMASTQNPCRPCSASGPFLRRIRMAHSAADILQNALIP